MLPPQVCGNIGSPQRKNPRFFAANIASVGSQARRARPLTWVMNWSAIRQTVKFLRKNGVPYEIRTRVTAVKEKRFTVIKRNSAAWIALYRTLKTHRHCYWTFIGRAKCYLWAGSRSLRTNGF